MSRIARIVVPGYPHHIVQRGNNKQDVFFDDRDRKNYLNLLKKYCQECECKIMAYCLMTNHIHMLLVPAHSNSLAKTMQKVSLTYTQYINQKFNRTGRLWECRFHSSIVDNDPHLWSVCRYIEQNPVRAKIVDKPLDYIWSSARLQVMNKSYDNFLPIWENPEKKSEYKRFLNSSAPIEEIALINKQTFKGKPIGSEHFTEKIASALNKK